MASQRDYTKDIIEEYNIRLRSWGNSNTWGLTEFKMLEDLIYESSKMRINANTLKRFFQQKTSNPQLATNNALCIFLGYSGYAEFVMKKTQEVAENNPSVETEPSQEIQEETKPNTTTQPPIVSDNNSNQKQRRSTSIRKYSQRSIIPVVVGIIILLVIGFWDKIQEKYENHLISSVVFESVLTKGASPFTMKVVYDIPEQLIDSMSVVCVEANGDITVRKLTNNRHETYATFIYPGRGHCYLKYKDKIIRTIEVESRTTGWSAYLMEERTNSYLYFPNDSLDTQKGHLTLPLNKIPREIVDHEKVGDNRLFVSYTYYTDSIVDGDNLIFEARLRNSKEEDSGIQCYDVMMYIFSNTGFHGLALNSDGCQSYRKFVSSENEEKGDQHDLSYIKFDPDSWHIMRIEVIDKKTTFYLDGKEIRSMNYNTSLGTANELTLRFKGCGAVDYVKVMNLDKKVVYEKQFGEKK
ncbi:hypothetical protein [Dysgonomonas sp. 520]|uniref:hypothetical protein n=1 Tax=Dysgonomonas sp. 520 TaxID=2302931 RepID=UPI0013D1CBDF|nr:hypothetical protein [Dysgonomonas sp. 520]NDW08547.1 hypothetical protein [Dysgonomonas sp. 520]